MKVKKGDTIKLMLPGDGTAEELGPFVVLDIFIDDAVIVALGEV